MQPLAYMLTFRTYATWLPGDRRGFVTRDRSGYRTPLCGASHPLEDAMAARQEHPSLELDAARRGAVEAAIREHCAHREWRLSALNVRTNHVHSVVAAGKPPERVMNELKSWSTRRMMRDGLLVEGAKAWHATGARGICGPRRRWSRRVGTCSTGKTRRGGVG
jgi:REP element-mobilizing transposase RayT